jgi:hypothetical protein
MKQYMVIENFAPGRKDEIYKRFHEKGRMLPNGLAYLERFPSDMNRDSQRGGKGGVLASDSACEANHGQTLFTGLTGTCDRSG